MAFEERKLCAFSIYIVRERGRARDRKFSESRALFMWLIVQKKLQIVYFGRMKEGPKFKF